MFFSYGGDDFVCTGAAIGSSAVLTAGHCVHEGNGTSLGWHSNFVFVPAYRSGLDPLGIWTASTLWTTADWFSGGALGDPTHDYGAAVLFENSGLSISDTVGHLGATWNRNPVQRFRILGYPAAPLPPPRPSYDGEAMWSCKKKTAYLIPNGSPAQVAVHCNMTGGSSGGPWIVKNRLVNSVMSYGRDVDESAGPYFGDDFEEFLQEILAASP